MLPCLAVLLCPLAGRSRAGTSASLNFTLPDLKIFIYVCVCALFTKQSQLICLSSQGFRMSFQQGFVEFATVIS